MFIIEVVYMYANGVGKILETPLNIMQSCSTPLQPLYIYVNEYTCDRINLNWTYYPYIGRIYGTVAPDEVVSVYLGGKLSSIYIDL